MVFERRVVQQLLTGFFFLVLWFARKGTSDSTGGRAHNPPPLCRRSWCWKEVRARVCRCMEMKVKRIHTCHSHCCINGRTQPLLLNQLLSVPATAWQERHAEEGLSRSREAQCGSPAGDGAVTTSTEEETRGEANCGRAVHTGLM